MVRSSFALLAATTIALAACSPNASETPKPMEAKVEPDVAGLTQVCADFGAAMDAKNYPAMTDLSVPQPLVEAIFKSAGAPPNYTAAQFRLQLQMIMAKTMDSVKFLEFHVECETAPILTSATGRQHALAPATVVMEIQGQTVRSSNNYLALVDGDRWYLLNPSTADAIKQIKATFPDLASLDLHEPQMDLISQ